MKNKESNDPENNRLVGSWNFVRIVSICLIAVSVMVLVYLIS